MIIKPIVVGPIMPPYTWVDKISLPTALYLLSALAVISFSVLVGWTLTKVMCQKGFVNNPTLNLISSGVIGLSLFLRYGLSVTLLQGLFLFFVLLYASMSDLTDHTVDDHVWVTVFALSLLSIHTVGLTSMVIAGLIVLIPQIAMAMIPPHRTLGGADIKLSVATAFLLGGLRGITAYLVGLLIGVIVMSIYNKKHKSCPKKPFALVPFVSIGAMLLFFV